MDRSTSANSSADDADRRAGSSTRVDSNSDRTTGFPARPPVSADTEFRLGDSPSVLILGASARAAACSALRGGCRPWCADLFADVDLQAVCPARAVSGYPHALAEAARAGPPGVWMYTGGLENHPRLVDQIAAERPLAGNSGRVLRGVRNPFRVAAALADAGLPCCEVRRRPNGLPADGTWLEKRFKSSGGSGVRTWQGEPPARGVYYQQRIDGLPTAGVFLADGRDAMLLGVTQQLVGSPWLAARPFHYAGSLGPLDLGAAQPDQWERIGRALAARFELRGLFGVDAIVRDGTVWPVEVNPRFPASVEVLERAGSFSAVAAHLAACAETLPESAPAYRAGWQGKSIVFAPHDGLVPQALLDQAAKSNAESLLPAAADLPAAGSRIPAGRPILTVLARGATRDQVLKRLRREGECYAQLLPAAALAAIDYDVQC